MRASSQTRLSDRRRALLEQASVALRGHLVALWRLSGGQAVAELISRPGLPQQFAEFDVAGLLKRWGRVAPAGSLWVGCRIDADHWHVAPVRSDPPEPPPTGIERRSSGSKVRTVPVSVTSSGITLNACPPWMAPTVTTAEPRGFPQSMQNLAPASLPRPQYVHTVKAEGAPLGA